MPVIRFCLVFIALASPVEAQALLGDDAPPVARLQPADDWFALPPGSAVRPDRSSAPIRFLSDVIDLGSALIAGNRLFTEAAFNGGSMSGPRLDLSIGLNF